MPLVHSETIPDNCLLMVWELTESEDTLRQLLPDLTSHEELQAISHPQKKREWLAGRLIIRKLTQATGIAFSGLWKDDHGKPFLVDSQHYISLTHTLDYVAAVIHPHSPLGIDMEKMHEKLIRTAPKYLTEPERVHAGSRLPELSILWCAKEALYKLNGRKKVSFKDNISIVPFEEKATTAQGILRTDNKQIKATLYIRWFGDYCLVVAI